MSKLVVMSGNDRALKANESSPLALFLPSLAGGGSERTMLNLAEGFIARGYRVDIVLAKAVGEYLDETPSGARVIDLGASRPMTAVPALARYLLKERPKALLSKISNSNFAALFAIQLTRSRTRCVVCEESTLSIDLENSPRFNQLVLPRILKYYYPRAHGVVTLSRGSADDVARVIGLSRQAIHVIYSPVATASLLDRSKQPIDHGWLQGNDVPVIVGMGRLTRQKDFGTLIRAFAQVRKQLPSRLLILGEGEDRIPLEDLCRHLGVADDVNLPGFVANPYAYLARAALFVLSSRWEGFGNVLGEALAVGTPVVSTDCPNGPSEILNGGAYGQLVPVENDEAMAAAIIRSMKGDFVAAPQNDQLGLFDADANIDRYLDLLVGGPVAAPQQS